ncbi:MAG: sigma-54 dependent transcriptional regulator [Ignavibacteria bacterium]|nr:sigma-54 dependent transcriptional regulator [Ignavibacteria bacterium]
MKDKISICIVDDEEIVRESLFHWFIEEGYSVETASTGEEALKKFDKNNFSLLLVDMKMPGMNGLDLLSKIKAISDETIVILITAFASVSTAIKALKWGAYDYITKPVDPVELSHIVQNALKLQIVHRENIKLKKMVDRIYDDNIFLTHSAVMTRLLNNIKNIAATETTVILCGENGTGKNSLAKMIHSNSKQKYSELKIIECMKKKEIESDTTLLFSDITFFYAEKIEELLFDLDGGSIFFNNIEMLTIDEQDKLFVVLQKFLKPDGDSAFNLRIIASCNLNIEALVVDNKFSDTLYTLLNPIMVEIPPLKERNSDVILLSNFFVERISVILNKNIFSFTEEALELLTNCSWKGNVRELKNAIEFAVIHCEDNLIDAIHLPTSVTRSVEIISGRDLSLNSLEKNYITHVLNDNGWNISKCSRILEIDRVTLYNKINRYEIKREVES